MYLLQLVGSEITCTHKIEMAHAGEVLSLLFLVKTPPSATDGGEQLLVSGGRDGKVRGWDAKLS